MTGTGGWLSTRTTNGSATAGFAANRPRAAANTKRARAAPGALGDVPTQRQCHGSHFTPCLFPAGKDCSNPNRAALATSQRAGAVAAMHASASGQLGEGRTAKSIA